MVDRLKKSDNEHKRYGMLINLDKCTGCGSCMVACMLENNIPFKVDESNKLDSITWLRIYKVSNEKSYPNYDICYIPRPCQQCEGNHGHSPCVSVCPATATDYNFKTGIVSQIYTRCFGCRYCMAACPYHARYFNWWDPVWPKGMEKYLSPDVSVRMRGVVEKCSFCFHRYQLAKNAAIAKGSFVKESDYQTACARACPSGAIKFGDLNNTEHEVNNIVKPDLNFGGRSTNPLVFRILEKLGTNPKVYYMSERKWVRNICDNYLSV